MSDPVQAASGAAAAAELVDRAGIDVTQPDFLPLILGLLGGLALFLFGLEQMTIALKAIAGDRLRTVLSRVTVNRITGVATGAFVTSVIQSSSVTTVLVIGFISSGLMSLSQAVGVIMGANIGTTVTAQIVAFQVTKLASVLLFVGFALTLLSKRDGLRHHGGGMLGLGLVFLGMTVMSDSMAPLSGYPPFIDWMVRFESPLIGILVSAAFTGVVQSSSATTGVVIAMASQGLITLPAGIALIFGANIGTCVTAMLASIGKPREAVRAALVHLIFNLAGVLVWFGFIGDLAAFAAQISPEDPTLAGASRMAAETPRQIANAHTIFNVANTLIFLPFAGLLARIVEYLVPDRPITDESDVRAQFLDESLISTPAIALDQVRRELVRLGRLLERMFAAVLPAMLTGGSDALIAVAKMDEDIDRIHRQVIGYLGRIGERTLSQSETKEFIHLMSIANSLESVGDTIETNLVARGRGRVAENVEISPGTIRAISDFHSEVAQALHDMIVAFETRDAALARKVVDLKPRIHGLADAAASHEARRLMAEAGNRIPSYSVEIDMIEDIGRVYYYVKRISRRLLAFEPESKSASAEAEVAA